MDSINLRALTQADLPLTLKWHNQPDIVDLYAGHPFPVNREMEQKWYDRILVSNYPTTVFGIEITGSAKLIGISILRDIDMLNRSAETAIYIGDLDERGKGRSKDALAQTLHFACKDLGLHRVWLRVRDDNTAAFQLYKNMGFKEEGILRDAIYKKGVFHNVFIMSLLDSEINAD